MKVITLLLIALALLPHQALGQAETRCEIAAFVANPLSGVRVRSHADADSTVVGRLPPDPGGTLVFINGAKNGWMKVSSAINAAGTNVFNGAGWIHGPLLFVRANGPNDRLVRYHASPGDRDEFIGSIRAGLEVSLLGCTEDWVNVLIPVRGTDGTEGWLPRGAWCASPWEDCM